MDIAIKDGIIGKRFGKLIVKEFSHFYIKPSDGKKEKRWLCLCDCGGTTITAKRKLETGWSRSCGCLTKTRGGITKSKEYHPTYSVWNMIIQRVTNPNFQQGDEDHYYYGYVEIVDRWMGDNGFHNFIDDMGLRPSNKHSIDRIDPEKGYCKENCRWTCDNSMQSFNQLRRKNNTSGKTGVGWDGNTNKWFATITRLGERRKRFCSSFEEACLVRDSWELELYGFNKNNNIRQRIEEG